MKRSWIRKLFARPKVRTIRMAPHKFRPDLKILEDRWVPSTFVVNNPTDTAVTGEIDLRQAIASANSTNGANTITFNATVFATPQTITLNGVQLELSNTSGTQTITGPTAGVTVDGAGLSRVFQIDANVTANITGLTVSGGYSAYSGGGIYNEGTLHLSHVTVSGNSSTAYYGGGGGVENTSTATLVMSNCTVSGNTAAFLGGGVLNYGTATLTNTTVSGNTAYDGAGVLNYGGTLDMANCTISGNTGYLGGGIANSGTFRMVNCTISGNSALEGGGALNLDSTLTMLNCTISGNSASYYGGGVFNNYYYGTTNMGNTIVAGNTASIAAPDVVGSINSLGNNLIGDTTDSSGWLGSDLTGTAAQPLNPVMAPLGNYGGPTETMPLLPGSPALGAGSVSLLPTGLTTDQRGEPRTLNGNVDIGAFESQGFTLTIVPGSTPQSSPIGTAFPNPLGVTITANNPIEPVDGGIVNYVPNPATNGASAILSASSAVIASGEASVTAAPDNVDGTYTVVASVGNMSATFTLTNGGTPYSSLIVNTTVDSIAPGPGLLSLREAVGFADDQISGTANITFDPTVFATNQTITLTLGQLELSNPAVIETITGPSMGVTVDGNAASQIFVVDAGVTASITGMTITDGDGISGGVKNSGTLTLTNCTVSGNTATGNGGGLYNSGNLTLNDCTVSGNTGDGVDNQNGTLTVADSTITGNTGDGVRNFGTAATATFTDTTLSDNVLSGVWNYEGTINLTDCTVSGNTYFVGSGIDSWDGGTATLINCTITGNSGEVGGGIYNSGTMTLANCTVTDNSASYYGGGIFSEYYATTTLENTIVAGNTAVYTGPDVDGTVNSLGNNLIGNSTGSTGWIGTDLTGTAAQPIDPLLAPLGNYGGSTETMPLLPGSPAIGAGSVSLIPGGITTDQRGEPRTLNGNVDIGSFESQGFVLTVVPGSTPQTSPIGTAFPNPLGVTITANNPIEPVDGGIVTYVPHPATNGASAILSSYTVVIANGEASVIAAPDNVDGTYEVTASCSGATAIATFTLTNTGAVYTSLLVNTTVDSIAPGPGLLSLREAVDFADDYTSGTADITFDPTVFATPQTITLSLGVLELTNTTITETITGPAAGVTVDGNALSQIFLVDAGVTASISGMTITDGAGVDGGGINNAGTLTLTDCTVSGNTSTGPGGGIYNSGTLTLTDCTVTGNISTGTRAAGFGGGILNSASGTMTLTGTTVSNNTGYDGGGLFSYGTATLTDCTVTGNTAHYQGGGIFNYGTITLTDSTISYNTIAYYGGGMTNFGTATLTNCTISGNTAGRGGAGILNISALTMTNCTVAANSASYDGGGIWNVEGTATLINCTISGNSAEEGGGVYNGYYGTLNIGNSIVAKNTATYDYPDVDGTFTSYGYNLIGDDTGGTGWVASDLTGTTARPINPLLAPLGNYGGPTETMPLLPGSRALDNGDNTLIPSGITTDERGYPRIVAGTVDIGAFESGGFTVTIVQGSPQITLLSTAFPLTLEVLVTANNPIEPVAGGEIKFTPPATGASATIATSPATIASDGTATVTATANATAGTYTVKAKDRGITTAADFILTNATTAATTFSNLQSLTIVYGTPQTTLGGHIGFGADYPTGLTVSITLDGVTQVATIDANGDFASTFSTGKLTVAGSPYPITYAFAGNSFFGAVTDTSTTLTVIPATLTITDNETKTYGTLFTFDGLNFTETGLITANGDSISNVTETSTGAPISAPVGTYPIVITGAIGSGLSNYTIEFGSSTLTVTPANLVLSASINKAYGTLVTTADTVLIESGLVTANGDTLTGLTLTSTGDPISAVVGTYTINVSNATGTGLSNYTITYEDGTLTVTPAALTITAINGSKTYGTFDSLNSTAFNETGLVTANGDTLTGVTETSTGSSVAATVGTYPIVPSGATGSGLSNYTIVYVDGTLTVNPATLTITANSDNKTYGTLDPLTGADFTETGLVTANGDTITGVTETSLGAPMSALVGVYPIVPSNPTGSGLSNYSIYYVHGTLTVAPATLTITDNENKTYGTLETFSGTNFTETGLVTANGDTITGVTETSTGAPALAPVGTYPIVVSNATGSGLYNYNINYVNGSLVVGEASTGTTVTSSANPSTIDQAVTFTATVTTGFGSFDNGGTVQFSIDGSNYGSPMPLSNGKATITDAGLTLGTHTITATYSGDSVYGASDGAMTDVQTVELASGTISGTIFRDYNLNGKQDGNEPVLAGQTVFLDLNGTGVLASNDPTAITDANGDYTISYTNLMPGNYNVREVLYGGVLVSTPSSNTDTLAIGTQTIFTNQNFGDVLTNIAVPLTLPPSSAFPAQGNGNADYVEALYRTILDRNADPNGLSYYAGLLNSKADTRQQVVASLLSSPEHYLLEVNNFYESFLGRKGEAGGVQNWLKHLEQGMSEEQVATYFLESPEFLGKGDMHFVVTMYQTVLGREVDASGEASYLNDLGDSPTGVAIINPTSTYLQIIDDFLFSTESFERLIEGYYEVFLQRTSDSTGMGTWVGQLQKNASFATIYQSFLTSAEFYQNAAANR